MKDLYFDVLNGVFVNDVVYEKSISLERLIYLTENIDLDFTSSADDSYRYLRITEVPEDSENAVKQWMQSTA